MSVDRQASAGSDPLAVPLRCPGCGRAGLVQWTKLQNSIRCPTCDCEFVVTRGGQVRRVAELPHVRYSCPRCHKSGMIPAQLATRQARCPECRLPLARGPDQRFRGVQEAAALWRASEGRSHSLPWAERLSQAITTKDGRIRKTNVALAALPLLILVVAGVMALATLLDFSLETRARRFALACLSGSDAAMEAYVEDDAVQLVELKRWVSWHFASIKDRHRPKGDSVTVDAQQVDQRSAYRILLVTLQSPHVGVRRHIQYWRQQEGQWVFDSRATMAELDGTTAKPARRRPQQR